jgi:hypothetical protein
MTHINAWWLINIGLTIQFSSSAVQQFKLTAALRLTIAQNQFYKCSLTALSFLARLQHTLKLREKQ